MGLGWKKTEAHKHEGSIVSVILLVITEEKLYRIYFLFNPMWATAGKVLINSKGKKREIEEE